MFRIMGFVVSYVVVFMAGIALGIYLLPILTAPNGPDQVALSAATSNAKYSVEFTRDLSGSDAFHWGEGKVSISSEKVAHMGKLSPGPDYKLYLVKEFVEDEAGFKAAKSSSLRLGDIKSFNGFIVDIPAGTDIEAYNSIVVWCEAFEEFITAAKYR